MFRVVGRDARGQRQEVSVVASTEAEARTLAQGAGLVAIDSVSIPPPASPSRLPRLSGFTIGCLGSLACLGFVVLGTVVGAILGKQMEPPGPEPGEVAVQALFGIPPLRMEWMRAAAGGAVIGLLCGTGVLVACYRHCRDRV